MTDPLLSDSDGDGINDYIEVSIYNSDPNNRDTDGDGISDRTDLTTGANLTINDHDGDETLNSAEDSDVDAFSSIDNSGSSDPPTSGGGSDPLLLFVTALLLATSYELRRDPIKSKKLSRQK